MQSSPSLTELAKSILEDSQAIDSFLSSHNLPQPSFASDGIKDFPVGTEHADIHAIRHRLIDATRELRDLVICPKDTIKWMIMNVSNLNSMSLLCFVTALLECPNKFSCKVFH